MKANNLLGEYCQSCAAILDDVQRNHRRVIVLDSQCASVFTQSGDAARLDDRPAQKTPAADAVTADAGTAAKDAAEKPKTKNPPRTRKKHRRKS